MIIRLVGSQRKTFPKVLAIVSSVSAIAKRLSASPGQVALAWLLAQGDDIIPIPGTRKQQVYLFIVYLIQQIAHLVLRPPVSPREPRRAQDEADVR